MNYHFINPKNETNIFFSLFLESKNYINNYIDNLLEHFKINSFIWIFNHNDNCLDILAFPFIFSNRIIKKIDFENVNLITKTFFSMDNILIKVSDAKNLNPFINEFDIRADSYFFTFPIFIYEKVVGVLMFLFDDIDFNNTKTSNFLKNSFGNLSDYLIRSYDNLELKTSNKFYENSNTSFNLNDAMQKLVEVSNYLTCADSSTLFLLNKNEKSFNVAFRYPKKNDEED